MITTGRCVGTEVCRKVVFKELGCLSLPRLTNIFHPKRGQKSFYYSEVCYYTINVPFRQDHTGADFTADFYLAVLAESPKYGLGVEMRVAFGTRPFISSFSFVLGWGQKM